MVEGVGRKGSLVNEGSLGEERDIVRGSWRI